MAKTTKKTNGSAHPIQDSSGVSEESKSRPIALSGLNSVDRISAFMSALVSDMMTGYVPAKVGNSVVNATGKILKGLELKHRWGAGKDLKTF